jgi:hypothetical protein
MITALTLNLAFNDPVEDAASFLEILAAGIRTTKARLSGFAMGAPTAAPAARRADPVPALDTTAAAPAAEEGDADSGDDTSTETGADGKLKRKRRTKAEMEAARAAEAQGSAPAATVAAAPTTPAATAQKSVSVDTLRAAIGRCIQANGGAEKAKAVLAKHGATRMSDLKPEQFAAVLADIEAA